jgi:hypothetical protein
VPLASLQIAPGQLPEEVTARTAAMIRVLFVLTCPVAEALPMLTDGAVHKVDEEHPARAHAALAGQRCGTYRRYTLEQYFRSVGHTLQYLCSAPQFFGMPDVALVDFKTCKVFLNHHR